MFAVIGWVLAIAVTIVVLQGIASARAKGRYLDRQLAEEYKRLQLMSDERHQSDNRRRELQAWNDRIHDLRRQRIEREEFALKLELDELGLATKYVESEQRWIRALSDLEKLNRKKFKP